ncbi:hypothetical protein ACEQ8H_002056 [Pleosporales sp. CAS-2024a]
MTSPSMPPITCTEGYLSSLQKLVESRNVLETHGFIFGPLSDDELLAKRQCAGCGKSMSQLMRKQKRPPKPPKEAAQEAAPQLPAIAGAKAKAPELTPAKKATIEDRSEEQKYRCRFHLGDCVNRVWQCCEQAATPKTQPCGGALEHVPIEQDLGYLANLYQFYPTPDKPRNRTSIRRAVAIDCEMGQAASGDRELIRITLIDYFTSAVLIDNLVEPDVPMSHLNTKYSGVTWADMKKARKEKTILRGKAAARRAVWKLVVDSGVTEFIRVKREEAAAAKIAEALKAEALKAEAEMMSNDITLPPEGGNKKAVLAQKESGVKVTNAKAESGPGRERSALSLKALTKSKLGRDIQNKGKAGHDSLEDAIAARDLVHCNVLELMGNQLVDLGN